MSDKANKRTDHTGSFVRRWSQRKLQHQSGISTNPPEQDPLPEQPAVEPVREADLPPLETLHEDSEISMFLSEGISEQIQRQALRRLFHFGKFNVCDGLDDYAEDYTIFQPLSELFNVKQQLEQITRKSDVPDAQPQPSQATVMPETDTGDQVSTSLDHIEHDDKSEKG